MRDKQDVFVNYHAPAGVILDHKVKGSELPENA